MALQARTIKAKINSVGNIQKITRAMELVSVSKMKKATDTALSSRPYAERALEILVNVSKQRTVNHRLFSHGDVKRNLVVLFSSNKGLCGSFNVNVEKGVKTFLERVHAKREAEIRFVTVGKRSEKVARKIGGDIVGSFIDLPEKIALEDVLPLARLLVDEFETGEYHNIVLVYTNFISALSNEVLARQLLPVTVENVRNMMEDAGGKGQKGEDVADLSNYLFEPSEDEVVDRILRDLVEVQVYQALLESRASEHSSRMIAMKNATENAEKLSRELTLSYNRARQAAITREISEIASGAEALSGA
ncbi:MAG: ATP synthase F1 subunit gamma [Candidatus Paceibacterota bacterium]